MNQVVFYLLIIILNNCLWMLFVRGIVKAFKTRGANVPQIQMNMPKKIEQIIEKKILEKEEPSDEFMNLEDAYFPDVLKSKNLNI